MFEACARNILIPLQDCIINVMPRHLQILPSFEMFAFDLKKIDNYFKIMNVIV